MTVANHVTLVLVAGCIAGSAVLRGAQQRGARDYAELIAQYRQQNASAVSDILLLAPADFERAIDSAATFAAADLRAAAMLHIDACFHLLARGSSDGAFRQLSAAMRLAEHASLLDEASRRFVATWYAAVDGMLRAAGAGAWAASARERKARVVPLSEAERRFLAGIDFETTACGNHDALLFDTFGMKTSRPLRQAITEFESALQRDPRLYSAALHLGRAHLLQANTEQARRYLDVATGSPAHGERYLAHLFLGALAERAHAVADAEGHYRRAIADFRWGQAGPFALAALLSRTNREAASRQTIEELLGRSTPTVDPLWSYLSDPSREPGMVLDMLRAETWQ